MPQSKSTTGHTTSYVPASRPLHYAAATANARAAKAKAKEEASREAESARQAIVTERKAAVAELKAEVAKLSVSIAEKLIRTELSSDDKQQALVQKLIDESPLN